MISSDAETDSCNFCENNFNYNIKNIEDVKDLYKKCKINFDLCSAYMFSFITQKRCIISVKIT